MNMVILRLQAGFAWKFQQKLCISCFYVSVISNPCSKEYSLVKSHLSFRFNDIFQFSLIYSATLDKIRSVVPQLPLLKLDLNFLWK